MRQGVHGRTAPTSAAFAGADAIAEFIPPARLRSSEDSIQSRAQLRPEPGNRRTADHRHRTSVEKGAHRRKAPAPIRAGFAGADASAKRSPPRRPCSSEDSFRFRAQLRPETGNRRRADHRHRTSVEKGAHRRKAPTPTRHAFAGGEASAKSLPPRRTRSSEDSIQSRAQLRPEPGNRRTADHRHRNSVEKGAHRRKAPTPTRHAFAGAEASANRSPPRRPCSSEDSFRSRAQLRPEPGNRRTADHRNPTSVDKGAHRRKAPTPTRHAFAGAEASTKVSPPTRTRSSEDSFRFRAQLRPAAGNRRKTDHRHPTSDVSAFSGRWEAPAELVQKFFNILDTFPFTNYTYRGIIISR